MKKRIISIFVLIVMLIGSIFSTVVNADFSVDFITMYLYQSNPDEPCILQDLNNLYVFDQTLIGSNTTNEAVSRWIRGTVLLTMTINESCTADEIVSFYKNDAETVNKGHIVLGLASEYLGYGYKWERDDGEYVEKSVIEGYKKEMAYNTRELQLVISEASGYDVNDNYFVLSAKTSEDKFQDYISKADQKLKAAYDTIKNGDFVGPVPIENDYETLFKYNKNSIKTFIKPYGADYLTVLNYLNDYQKKTLDKCWKIKAALDDNDTLATYSGIFIQENDTYLRKLSYTLDEIRLYIALFGKNPKCDTTAQNNNVKSEWSYVLSHNGEHSLAYKQCLQPGHSKSEYSNENGDKSGLDKFEVDEEATSSQWEEFIKGEIAEREDTLEDYRGNWRGTKYFFPDKTSKGSEYTNIDEIVTDGENFVNNSNKDEITSDSLQNLSNSIYNILLIVGVIIAVLVGAIIGIKFMVGSVEEKADVKKLLVPYIIGCVVVFGAFGVWKIVVIILSSI